VTLRAVITAGGTTEPIDDVRVVTNLSTGRFGAAIARALVARGVEVTLLAGKALARQPTWIPEGVEVVPFGSFKDLDKVLSEAIVDPPDLLFMAAAVSDYSPIPTDGKIRSDAEEIVIRMRRNPKLLSRLREQCGPHTWLVGFKLLSGVSDEELRAVAHRQAIGCDLDLTLANDLQHLGRDRHPAVFVAPYGDAIPVDGTKDETAVQLVDHCLTSIGAARWPVTASAESAPWFVERGFLISGREPPAVFLSPPSARDDLHAGASVCLVDLAAGKVLIGRRKTQSFRDYWAFPGGRLDPGETLRECALRELTEETGVTVDVEEPLLVTEVQVSSGEGEKAWEVTNFAWICTDPGNPRETDELAAEWVAIDDLNSLRPMAAGTRRVLRELLASLPARK